MMNADQIREATKEQLAEEIAATEWQQAAIRNLREAAALKTFAGADLIDSETGDTIRQATDAEIIESVLDAGYEGHITCEEASHGRAWVQQA